ncbi:MAG: NnrU family protein [Pseudomonadota bacterium]
MVIFFGMHLVPVTDLKNNLITRFGERRYKILFVILSLAGFLLMIQGFQQSDYIVLWEPIQHHRAIIFIAMPIALILFVASKIKCNIGNLIKHPMLSAICIWGIAHLLANGDLASSLIFASFVIYSVLDMILTPKKTKPQKHSFIKDILVIAIGAGLYIALIFIHPYITNVHII